MIPSLQALAVATSYEFFAFTFEHGTLVAKKLLGVGVGTRVGAGVAALLGAVDGALVSVAVGAVDGDWDGAEVGLGTGGAVGTKS